MLTFASFGATNSIPWRVPAYSLTARTMPVRQALDTFAVAEGVPVVMSDAVGGVISGKFEDMPASEFLDRIATVNNLTWYYDGAAIYVTGAGEMLSTLIDLRYMKADEVRRMLGELGVEDARYPIKTASDDELIMVSGPPRYVQLVSEMIAKADKLREQRTFNEVETRLFPLYHTWADNVSFRVNTSETQLQITGVARLLEELMAASNGMKAREATNSTDAAENRLAETMSQSYHPVIRPENRLNAVLVRDVVTRMPMYERLVRELDRPQKLVEIEVTTLELAQGDALDWQMSLRVTGNRNDFSGGAGQNVRNLTDVRESGSGGLAGSVTYLGDNVQVMASLEALRTKSKARSISRTSLVTVNNLAAEISDEQSYHTRVVGEKVASLETVTAGTRLQIKPRILPSTLTNDTKQVWISMVLKDGGFESVTVDAMPMDRSSTLTTQAAIYEGESILLAGYLRDVDEDAGWGIPYLRDIPWIGWIFGGKSTVKQTVQRMFVLTPRVIDLEQADLPKLQATRQRDIVPVEELEDCAEESDDERAKREKRREGDRRERRERLRRDLERIEKENAAKAEAAEREAAAAKRND